MTDANALDRAIRRLQGAADAVEAAVAQSIEKARSGRDRASEIAALAEDRTRLAEELDACTARAGTLSHVNREVSRRLDQAIDSIRSVIAAHER